MPWYWIANLSRFSLPALALYVHLPWCVKKCPYCDFNSHTLPSSDNEALFDNYVTALLDDLKGQLPFVQHRPITSVFIGGGTPSLLPPIQYQRLFATLRQWLNFTDDCEITLEANPGTLEHAPFEAYRSVGINRLSLGVQSFDESSLKRLGRIHNPSQAKRAIMAARAAGFARINVDLMHGLPNQTPTQALDDLYLAIELGATHLSWYQLTIEPNTIFYRRPPILPDEDTLADIEMLGAKLMVQQGFFRYEVSAWVSGDDHPCWHNLNYWHFGDYLAIGAGAHGKVTLEEGWTKGELPGVYRFSKSRSPKDYMSYEDYPRFVGVQRLDQKRLISEYMMNGLRLVAGTSVANFESTTHQSVQRIIPVWERLKHQGLMQDRPDQLVATDKGLLFVNRLVQAFL